jgi:hypothetical protein
MLFNKQLLFQHIPKTCGMSVKSYLQQALLPPVLVNTSIPDIMDQHLTLDKSYEFIKSVGWDTKNMTVLCVFRNPYEVEVSFYFYFRERFPNYTPNEYPYLTLARDSFEAYIKNNTMWNSFEYYIQDNNVFPDKLNIIKAEDDLSNKLKSLVSELGGNTNIAFPHINTTTHNHFSTYYTPDLEEIIYNKYKWVFDNNYYNRYDGLLFNNNIIY